MDLFEQFEDFEEKNEYWGLDELKWDWKAIMVDKETVRAYVDTTFSQLGVGARKYKINKCMDFKKLALSVSGLFVKSRELKVTEDMKALVGELKDLFVAAVTAYYNVFKVNIPGPTPDDPVTAIVLPFGPWILFSKIEWEEFIAGQREIRMNSVLAVARSGSDKAEADDNGDQDGLGRAQNAGTGPPPSVGLPVDQEINGEEDIDGKQLEPENRTTRNRSPPRQPRVSFDLNSNRNSNRSSNRSNNRSNHRQRDRSRSRSRDRQSVSSRPSAMRNRERATASFDDQGFDDIEVRGPSSNAV